MPLKISAESLEDYRTRLLGIVQNKYYSTCNCVDPETGKEIYVDCEVNGVTYRMNAGKIASSTMKEGIDLAELQGFSEMPEVRDFNNIDHSGVSIADAKEINKLQAIDAYLHWKQKGEFVDAIRAATSISDLNNIDILFIVNT